MESIQFGRRSHQLRYWLGGHWQYSLDHGNLVACTKLVSGIQGFFDLFATTTGERGDSPVIPDAVGTEPEIHR